MKKIPAEMESLILKMLQNGEKYKTIEDRTGVSKTTIGRVAKENGIRRIKRNTEKVKENYQQELLEQWDRVRIEILTKG